MGVVGGEAGAEGEEQVLRFAAGQQVVLGSHVAALLGEPPEEAERLLEGLIGSGLLGRDRAVSETADSFRITAAGLAAVGSSLPAPAFAPDRRHAIGVAGLCLAGRAGRFGPIDGLFTEREMRFEDETGGKHSPFFVEPHEFGGSVERRYPDLVLVRDGERMALELLGRMPGEAQLAAALRAYAADVRFAHVVFLAVAPEVARSIVAVIRSVELSAMAHVRTVLPY